MRRNDGSFGVEIPRAGQHPYMPGAVRLSTVLAIAAWLLLGGVAASQLVEANARDIWTAIIVLSLGTGMIYGGGRIMAKDNPFHQEIILRGAIRTLRRRTNLET